MIRKAQNCLVHSSRVPHNGSVSRWIASVTSYSLVLSIKDDSRETRRDILGCNGKQILSRSLCQSMIKLAKSALAAVAGFFTCYTNATGDFLVLDRIVHLSIWINGFDVCDIRIRSSCLLVRNKLQI